MANIWRPAFTLFLILTVITGLIYPLLVTGVAQAVFPSQANGSLIGPDGSPAKDDSTAVGSRLIGQPFTNPGYFWSRPSGTGPFPYNAGASSGTNLGPLNPRQSDAVSGAVAAARDGAADQRAPVPVDLVTASGSGLDPHISPAAALYQVPRVAAARGLDGSRVEALVREHVEGRTLGVLGEPRVNVLELNLALDRLAPTAQQ
jgi:K+-transporting ATPase ATPase C chain